MQPHNLQAAGATSAEFDTLLQELAQLTTPTYAEDMRESVKGDIADLRQLVEYHRTHRPVSQPVIADAAPAKHTLKHRFWAPDKAFEMGLDTTELAVYFLLCRRAGSSFVAWPSYHDITAGCRISRRKVRPALARLLALGMIEVARPATSTKPASYRLTPPDTWKTPGRESA